MKINLDDFDILDIDDIQINTKKSTMYDIEIKNDNTFFISKNKKDNILIHNCDGSHIKGLIINMIDTYWHELLQQDFLYEFITPIVKVKKGKIIKYFYSSNEYDKWQKRTNNVQGYFVKFIKGLGTIEPHEAKLFFKDLSKHLIKFNSEDIKKEREHINLIFNQNRSDDRKNWLLDYIDNTKIDKINTKQTFESFFDNEFKEFSMSDNIRSIPSIVDGLKPSQRKVLYTLFKKNYKNEIKISQLSGAIMEFSAYHHGNVAIEQTIIQMAQNFVGANNQNLISPTGQFGTRLKGGKDASASRYIFTNLEKITRVIFNKLDDNILEYLDDDGYKVEPKYYIPIIPMVLVNGSDGIGTGWSSFIPKFNPIDIITYVENKLKKKRKNIKFLPWYKGFKGDITFDNENNKCISKGKVKKITNNRIKDSIYQINELPVGVWNDKYCVMLDKLIENEEIADYDDDSTDSIIDIKIKFSKKPINIHKTLHLKSSLSLNNMILFNEEGKIKRYSTQYDIIDEFFDVRLEYYKLRKKHILKVLEEQKLVIINKMKFINAVLKKKIIIENKTKKNIEEQIIKIKISKWDNSYDYLLNLSLIQLSIEKILELQKIFDRKKEEIKKITSTTIEKMWTSDLNELKKLL